MDQTAKQLLNFSREIKAAANKKSKETALEQGFNQAFFVNLLGYELYPGSSASWTAWPKPPSHQTKLSGEPDLLLGFNREDEFETLVVVELKKPGTPLDGPQLGYENRSPVEQAFDYARKIPTCRWVIVSDMRFVRLYSIESQDGFHEFDLWTAFEDEFNISDPKARFETVSEIVRLLSYGNLVEHGSDSPTARLLARVLDEQASFRDGFYRLYGEIRADLLEAIEVWSAGRHSRQEIVLSAQRLLDRLLFIFFCEDHPDRLLQHGLLEGVVSRAVQQPGPSKSKAYDNLKLLFRDLDVGVNTDHWSVPRYNGELFKPHQIVDELELSDQLNSKRYTWISPTDDTRRVVKGPFGLHVFDFWKELDRDLLGNLFERSIGDLTALVHGGRPDARKAFGVYYTASRLAKFVASSAVNASLAENSKLSFELDRIAKGGDQSESAVEGVFEAIKQYKVADLACGSGVFLTAALDALLNPYRKSLEGLRGGRITRAIQESRQSEILKGSIFGIDILPQAVELAKLALWLTAARRNEPSAELTSNFITGDALDGHTISTLKMNAGGGFDLVIGNPPWGGDYIPGFGERILNDLGIEGASHFDSWEIFLGLAIDSLKIGGRFALLVPDTIFSAEKRHIRRWLLETTRLEKVYSLGPDWFTTDVRMGTVVLQGVRTAPDSEARVSTLVLAGRERNQAQTGRRPIEQLEQAGQQWGFQATFTSDAESQIQVLASEEEMSLIRRVEAQSRAISEITTHSRGDEINAEGLIWRCENCHTYTVPGAKKKGGGYYDKSCPTCNARLSSSDVFPEALVSETPHGAYRTPYVDGGSLTRRYEAPIRKFIRTDIQPLVPSLKPISQYTGQAILIRQAGVGIVATLVDDNCRCPQSLYVYRVNEVGLDLGYTNEFVLGCLVSRTMNYISMKKFAEIDPAKAFAKLTHARIAQFPIPNISTEENRRQAARVSDLVRTLCNNNGDHRADIEIELILRSMWGISGDEGRFINGFFSILPEGQSVSDLFPNGAPPRIPFPMASR